jgi:hypothetical protein
MDFHPFKNYSEKRGFTKKKEVSLAPSVGMNMISTPCSEKAVHWRAIPFRFGMTALVSATVRSTKSALRKYKKQEMSGRETGLPKKRLDTTVQFPLKTVEFLRPEVSINQCVDKLEDFFLFSIGNQVQLV